MNKGLKLLLGVGLLLGQMPGVAGAVTASKTYVVSATLPAASGVGITASSVNATGTPVFTTVSGTALNFDPLTLNTTLGIWLPDHFFAIDVGPAGGPGTTDVTVTYTEGANPNTPGHGLGWKTTATFAKVSGATETILTTHPKKMLKDMTAGEHITPAELSNLPLRIYVGVADGSVGNPGEVITSADKAGAYNGSLLISATVS